MSFDNKTMRAPAFPKPHIAFIDGWWRVSSMVRVPGYFRSLYRDAHAFAAGQNARLHGYGNMIRDAIERMPK